MAIEIKEKASDSFNGKNATKNYNVFSPVASSKSDVIVAILASTPGVFEPGWTLYRDTDSIQVTEVGLIRGGTEILWRASIKYKRALVPKTNEEEISFDITLEDELITQSIKTISKATAEGEPERDFGGLIGVENNGEIRGVRVGRPRADFTLTRQVAPDELDNAYENLVYNLLGRTNSSVFRGKKEGEVRFVGLSGSARGGKDYELNFKFGYKKNRTNVAVGNGIVLPRVDGWNHVWKYTIDDHMEVTNTVIPIVVFAAAEQIFETGNLNGLGVGN